MIPLKVNCKGCNVQAIADGRYNLKALGWYKTRGYAWFCNLCKTEEDNKYIW